MQLSSWKKMCLFNKMWWVFLQNTVCKSSVTLYIGRWYSYENSNEDTAERIFDFFILSWMCSSVVRPVGGGVVPCSPGHGVVAGSQLVGGEGLFTVRANSERAVWHLIMPAAPAWWLASLWRTAAPPAKRGSHTITWPRCTHSQGLLVISTNHLLQLSVLIITSRPELVSCLLDRTSSAGGLTKFSKQICVKLTDSSTSLASCCFTVRYSLHVFTDNSHGPKASLHS